MNSTDWSVEDIIQLAENVRKLQQKAYEKGKANGGGENKRYAIHKVKCATGSKQVDRDGHWDGDAIIEVTTKAVIGEGQVECKVLTLTLAMDLWQAQIFRDVLAKEIEKIEKE